MNINPPWNMSNKCHLVSVWWRPTSPGVLFLTQASTLAGSGCGPGKRSDNSDCGKPQHRITISPPSSSSMTMQWYRIPARFFTWIPSQSRGAFESFLWAAPRRARECPLPGGHRPVRRCETNKAQPWIMRLKAHRMTWATKAIMTLVFTITI